MAAGAVSSSIGFALFTMTANFALALPILAVAAMLLLAGHV